MNSNNKNLSTIAKSKNLAKFNKSKIVNNNFEINFHIFKIKKTFINLQKTFTKTSILCHFVSKSNIEIETNILSFDISEIFNQIILY